MRLQFAPYILKFKEPAGTSRGVLTEKITCIMRLFDERNPSMFGIGEAAIFPGLSPEADDRFFYKLMELQVNIRLGRATDLSHFPSLQCGFEQCLRNFASGCGDTFFESEFNHGTGAIRINGLVWMGNFDEMLKRLDRKLAEGFECIKIKIGAIDRNKELELVKVVREHTSDRNIEIRVDANGGFSFEEAPEILHQLAQLQVSSIEQPIRAGQPEKMRILCESTPVPIALDEELIGKFNHEEKVEMLDCIKPQMIVLKPSLTGGFSGAEEWIELATERHIGWWITSSLESNIGLTALAQWTATLGLESAQGLGTGALYINNFDSPISTDGQWLRNNPDKHFDRKVLEGLDWRE